MNLDSLHLLASEAVLRADALTDLHAPGAEAAHVELSLLEERIAELTSASTTEGAIARQGAVGAAVLAGDMERAGRLVDLYCSEPDATAPLCDELRDLPTRLSSVRFSDHRDAIALGFKRADAKYGADEIVRLAEAIARQAEPLPIG